MKAAGAAYQNLEYWCGLHALERGRHSAVGYHAMGAAFNRVAYRIRKDAVRRLLNRHGANAATLLEAGAGIGAYGELWRESGVREWTGVDISPVAVETLTRLYPEHRFLQLDLTRDPIEAGHGFDLVTAIDVLYHLVEEAGFAHAVETLAGAVRPGGRLLLSDVFCERPRQVAAHVVRRPLARYAELLAPHGFRLVDREPVYAILGDPAPRPGSLRDAVLFQAWRAVSKAIRICPEGWMREIVGGSAAVALLPVDAWLRRMGVTRGVNLEMALFERSR